MSNVAHIPGTDADLRRAVTDANIPTLLLVMTQLVGDDRWLTDRFQPQPIVTPEGSMFPDDSGDYSDDVAAEIRAAAFELLRQVREEQPPLPAPPDTERLRQLLEFSVAEPVESTFAAMAMEELGFVNRDLQWLEPLRAALASGNRDFNVIVIGAGMSGICAGAKLKAAGINFVMLEKNDAVGGTWYENTYPDCGVDTPNHFYSFSFERNPNWSGYFSKRDELYEYFERCATDFALRDHLRLSTEVTAMRFDRNTQRWQVDVRGGDGAQETLEANVVISAVGQLNRPSIPDIPGIDTFAGPLFHSARWEHEHDFTGKRVAVVGTGCSAVQLLPKTAAAAAHVDVFQRSPHWVSPSRDYYRPVEEGLKWALANIPFYAEFHRARMIFGFADRTWPAVVADPDWPHPERSMNEVNEGLREALTTYIGEQLGDKRDQLLDACVPDFPVFGKRLIVDNGWYPTLARDNVDLVTSGIEAITPEGIRTADGQLHPVDVIIMGTGFKTNLFLWPMTVTGASGTDLRSRWGDAPNAYRGVTVPDYPNLFCLYGPNTNIVHGGSVIYQTECQVHYVMQCITAMVEQHIAALAVTDEVNTRYNEDVQARSEKLAWGHPGVESWYKNDAGRVINNSPFPLLEFWQKTHDVDLSDFEVVHGNA